MSVRSTIKSGVKIECILFSIFTKKTLNNCHGDLFLQIILSESSEWNYPGRPNIYSALYDWAALTKFYHSSCGEIDKCYIYNTSTVNYCYSFWTWISVKWSCTFAQVVYLVKSNCPTGNYHHDFQLFGTCLWETVGSKTSIVSKCSKYRLQKHLKKIIQMTVASRSSRFRWKRFEVRVILDSGGQDIPKFSQSPINWVSWIWRFLCDL